MECNLTSITRGDRSVAHWERGPKHEALGSVCSTKRKKKKVCPLKSLPSWLLPKKEAGEQWVTDRLPRDRIYTEVGHTEEG